MIEVTTKQSGPLLEGKAPGIVKATIEQKLDLAGQLLKGEVKLLTPVGSSGDLMGSIATTGVKRGVGGGYENRVVTPRAHGVVIERGRKYPGPMPPVGPIELWLRRKGKRIGFSQKNTKHMAYIIARKIALFGFKEQRGYRMFEKGLKNKQAEVQKLIGDDCVAEITSKLNGD
jgi:hypothetical protein